MDQFVRASVVFTRERVTEQPDQETDNRLLAEERQKRKDAQTRLPDGPKIDALPQVRG